MSYAAIGAVTGAMPIDLELQIINEIKNLKTEKQTYADKVQSRITSPLSRRKAKLKTKKRQKKTNSWRYGVRARNWT